MNFFVDKEVFRILPDYCVGVLVVNNFNNKILYPEVEQMLDEEVIHFNSQTQGINLKEDYRIVPYRTAFRLLNINPNKYLCSIEALAKRVQKKPELPHINSLVDIGNALSLKHFVPIGVHDIDQFEGDLMGVRFSMKEDYFHPMGKDEIEYPDEHELLYVSGHTVKTRRWTWRQSDDGKIEENTHNVLIVIDGFHGQNDINVSEAMDDMSQLIEKMTGEKPITGMVDRDHPVFKW